tara:strand:- start:3933 stop:4541 length:609 start_codon:yes stop_codon:yes gene_type:complete
MASEINWDANIEDLPKEDVEEWEFNLRPANDKGESDVIQSRIDPQLGRMVDELIQDAKGKGLPIKTRSDFVRLAVFRCVQDVQRHLNNNDEQITHYLLLEKQIMAEAQKSAMLESALGAIQLLTKGLTILSSESRQDWNEINRRVTAFLDPVLEMRISQPFLAKLYVDELFEYNRFKPILEKLKANKAISKTIKDAEKFYES